jgi:hypothetical protein
MHSQHWAPSVMYGWCLAHHHHSRHMHCSRHPPVAQCQHQSPYQQLLACCPAALCHHQPHCRSRFGPAPAPRSQLLWT